MHSLAAASPPGNSWSDALTTVTTANQMITEKNRLSRVRLGAAAQCAGVVSSWLLTAHSMSLQTFFPVSEESSTTAKPGTIQVLLEEGTVLHCRLHAAFCRLTSIGPLTWKPWWSGSQGLHLLIFSPKTHMKHLELDCCSGSSLTKLYFLNRRADSGSVRWFSTKYFFAFVMRIFKNWPVTWVGSVPGLEFSPLKIGTGPCLSCLTGVGEVKKIKNTSD